MKHQDATVAGWGEAGPLGILLRRGAETMGITLDAAQRTALLEYMEGVLAANRKINLTSIVEPEAAVRLHLLDSLTAVPELERAPEGPVLDLGSGGGFPGVPLSIATGREVVLLDSVGKKAVAVESVLHCMSPEVNARATAGRAEELASSSPAAYAAVVARAVAPLASLVELASPLLEDGGVLIALKGRPDDAEMASGISAAAIVGMTLAEVRNLTLPGTDERRRVVTFVKSGQPTVKLPRRVGLAQHDPLG